MKQHGYPVPAALNRVEDVIRRSRFVSVISRASTVEDAREFVAGIRGSDPGATHHCWAYLVGPPGSTARVGFSDDGEPHGTAGQPMLTTLLHSGVGDVVVVCTRYYGGVKLGTGGLARAYAGGVKHALESLTTVRKVSRVPAELSLAYPDVESVKRLLESFDITLLDEEYGARVQFTCGVPEPEWEAFLAAIADATNGRGAVKQLGDPVAE